MKTFVPVLALAAGVSATFHKAPPFSFPGNTDNKCTDKQKPGFSWDDLDFGDFFDYRDFNFRGWKCEDDGDKRSKFAPRTFGKAISGTCSSDKKKSPSFGCGASVDKFSLGSIHVKPEFDCDLEFHYDMPDGSTCKHRSACRKSGTTVVNRQCGGAKNVTIIYPPQPHLPKPSCTIKVPTISFDCDTASSTKPPKTKTTKTPPGTTAPPAEASTTPPAGTPPVESNTPPAETTSPAENTPPAETATPPVEATTPPAENTPPSETNTPPTESNTSPAENTPPAETNSAPEGSETSSVSPGQETSDVVVPPPVTKTITTSYDSTSTIFTTSIQTITSCAPTVPDCPANSVVTTVVTVAVSTTICPVTETLTTIEGPTSTAQPSDGPSEGPSDGPSEGPSDGPGATSAPEAATTSAPVAGGTTGVVSSVSPVETLPCPGVVPSCLNTFLFNTGCSDNTDTACYCPDATFVKNVYDCLYAHGETDSIIAEAVAYFQGICGKWVNENPAIATDATVTTYITVTAQPTVAPVYTTVIVDVTTVVPCTDDAGEIIPSSSTTVTVSTSMTVPQIDFTTGSSGGVEVVPITAVPAVTAPPTPSVDGPGVVITANGTAITVPTGTGALVPSSTSTHSVVVGAGGRVGASFGLAAAVAFAAALVL
ncbi:hypothetical protein F5144DRAFT_310068 [Chaetomium tenue]|uniref:Uncharacterized protein n=1 Tax=Chaetomium tenue TaxID=1854479 RepID=A0ACB7P5L2_9PEZI|nr:hypothetical protein F5144DRAFT_310068 [Chaetomium globosum]